MKGSWLLGLGGVMGMVLGLAACAQDGTPGGNPLACDPAVDQERCQDGTRQSCDPGANLWSVLEVCETDAACSVAGGVSVCGGVVPELDAGPTEPEDTIGTDPDAGPHQEDGFIIGPGADGAVIVDPTCENLEDCDTGCCNAAGNCDVDTDGDAVCDADDVCPGADDAHFADATCQECAPQFTGDACDACSDAKFTGAGCDECVDAKFTGDACDACADPKFTGAACDACADPKFIGEGCDLCADPKFTGLNCDQCIDLTFTGPNCDQCAYPCGDGSCDVCETEDNCPEDCVVDPGGCVNDLDCTIGQVCVEGECGDPPSPPTGDQCQTSPTCECALDHCTDEVEMEDPGGGDDPGMMGDMGGMELDLEAQICGGDDGGGGGGGGGMMGGMMGGDEPAGPSEECLAVMLSDYEQNGCTSTCAPDGVATLFGQDAVCQESVCASFLGTVSSNAEEDDGGGGGGMMGGGMMGDGGGGLGVQVDCGACAGGAGCSKDQDCAAGDVCLDGVCFADQSDSCDENAPNCACAVLSCGDGGAIVNSGGICASMDAHPDCWAEVQADYATKGCLSACYQDDSDGPVPGIDHLCFNPVCAGVLDVVEQSLGYDVCQSCPDDDPTVCASNAECSGGDECIEGDCIETPNAQCVDVSQCPPDHVCDEGWCKEDEPIPPCTESSECGAGQICEDGTCVQNTGPCTSDVECFPKICINAECVEGGPVKPPCVSDTQCSNGEVCIDDVCAPDPAASQCQQDPTCDCAFDECDTGGGGGMMGGDPKNDICGGDDEGGGGGMMGGMMGGGSGPSDECLVLMLGDFAFKGCTSECAPDGTATLFGQDAVCQQADCADYRESLSGEQGGGGGMMGGMMGGGGGGGGIEIDCGSCN